jgi:predicted SAM-dependent methyltransferase
MSKEISKSSKAVQLHLGCGKKCIPRFIHIDQNSHSHIDYKRDVRDLSIFTNDYVDLIYASHILEYFFRDEVDDVLVEWRRVLKPGGLLRLAVPDFEAIVKVYQKYNDLDHQGILGPLYGKWPYGDDPDKQNFTYHRTVYDFNSLKKVLLRTGFHNIQRYNWKKSIHSDFDDYSQAYIPHMDKENGILISLNVEAWKK